MNSINMIGNLTRDAELRFTAAKDAVCNFTIAYNRGGDADGQFFDCVMWKERAEKLSQYLTKGKKIAISGELNQRNYEKEGQKIYKNEIVVHHLDFCERKE